MLDSYMLYRQYLEMLNDVQGCGGVLDVGIKRHNEKDYEIAVWLTDETSKDAVMHLTGTGKPFIAFKLAQEYADKGRYCGFI